MVQFAKDVSFKNGHFCPLIFGTWPYSKTGQPFRQTTTNQLMPYINKLKELKAYCDQNDVKLIAISKTKSNAEIQEVYKAGHKIFGENKVQELIPKSESLPRDIEWHMVGHLQRNKVRNIAPFVSLIHSVDSVRLCDEIDKQAARGQRDIKCLLQIHIAEEDTKYGFSREDLIDFLDSEEFRSMEYVRIVGLMGIATFTTNEEQIRREFRWLANLQREIQTNYRNALPHFQELSMGMTNDYKIAVEEGSTMVRIGSSIFGERE